MEILIEILLYTGNTTGWAAGLMDKCSQAHHTWTRRARDEQARERRWTRSPRPCAACRAVPSRCPGGCARRGAMSSTAAACCSHTSSARGRRHLHQVLQRPRPEPEPAVVVPRPPDDGAPGDLGRLRLPAQPARGVLPPRSLQRPPLAPQLGRSTLPS